MSALTAGKSVRICVAWPMHTYSLAGASRNDSRRSMAAVLLTEALDRAVGTPAPERSLWESRQGWDCGRRPHWKWIGDARE